MPDIANINKDVSKKDILLNLLFIFCISYLFQLFVRQIFQFHYEYGGQEFYHISEWLISFEGGFVRRGIRGEIVYYLYHFIGLAPYTSIIFIAAISFIFLIIFFFKEFTKQGYSIFILPFVFFLGNPILNSFWLRPDSLLVILFIVTLYLLNKKKISLLNIFLINIVSIIGILLHEIFLFIATPITILLISYYLRTAFPKKCKNLIISCLCACLCLIPTFITILFVVTNNGSGEIATTIWESWKPLPFPSDFLSWASTNEYPGAFEGMTKTMKEGLGEYSGQFIIWFYDGLYGPLLIVATVGVSYFILSNVNILNNKILWFKPQNHQNKSLISSVLFLQLAVTIPLYILGWDYGRWIFFWVTSSFAMILIIPQYTLQSVIPAFITSISDKISSWTTQILGESKGVIILLSIIMGVPFSVWGIQNYLDTSVIYILFKHISYIFKYLIIYLR